MLSITAFENGKLLLCEKKTLKKIISASNIVKLIFSYLFVSFRVSDKILLNPLFKQN